MTGIFKDTPKAGRAILVPVTASLEEITSTEIPEIIAIKSKEYETLDQLFNITKFYAGEFLEKERLNSNLIINDSMERFRQLLCQQRGDFQQLQGVYEEYYYDHNEEIIRKDYLMIQDDGSAFMIGTYRYTGIVKNLGAKFLIDFRSQRREQSPVFYLMHRRGNPWKVFPGIFGAVTEDNREIAGNTVYLRKIHEASMEEQQFFQTYQDKTERILPYTDEFRSLNQELNNLGQRLSGKVGNFIITSNLQEAGSLPPNSRKVAYTFFYSACHLASSGEVKNLLKGIEELKSAFKHGFSDRILLEKEMKEGKALFSLRGLIDKDNFRINEDNWRKGAI